MCVLGSGDIDRNIIMIVHMKCMLILCMYMYAISQKFNTTVCTIIILCCSLFEYIQAKAIILWNLVCTKINGMYIIACLLMDMYIL